MPVWWKHGESRTNEPSFSIDDEHPTKTWRKHNESSSAFGLQPLNNDEYDEPMTKNQSENNIFKGKITNQVRKDNEFFDSGKSS